MPRPVVTPAWAEGWQRSWDRMEESLAPDREWLIAGLVELVEAVAGPQAVVIDLGCGTGSVALRLLERLPGASVIAVDVDPVLLTIASATFAGDSRVRIVTADLRSRDWARRLPDAPVDAVVTATALHWLPETAVRRLYRDLAGVIRPGGVFAHTERMPLVDTPTVGRAIALLVLDRQRRGFNAGEPSWDEWWKRAAADPRLEEAFARRADVFDATYTMEEFSPPASWHAAALYEAGFAEAGVVYRTGAGATVAAVR